MVFIFSPLLNLCLKYEYAPHVLVLDVLSCHITFRNCLRIFWNGLIISALIRHEYISSLIERTLVTVFHLTGKIVQLAIDYRLEILRSGGIVFDRFTKLFDKQDQSFSSFFLKDVIYISRRSCIFHIQIIADSIDIIVSCTVVEMDRCTQSCEWRERGSSRAEEEIGLSR